MYDSASMRERYRFTDPLEEPQALWKSGEAGQMVIQALALHKFHGVEPAAIGKSAHVMDGNNSGMLELRNDFCFVQQTSVLVTITVGEGNYFERDLSPKQDVFYAINAAHTAVSKFAYEAITRAGQVGRLRGRSQAFERAFSEPLHSTSIPNRARGSR